MPGGERDGGFTLIEMIVVVAVLALAAGLVLSRGPMRSVTVDLRAAARMLATDMRSTRARAIGTDRALLFTVDGVRGEYGAADEPPRVLPRGVVAVTGDRPVRRILFRADGSSSGGAFALQEEDRRIEVAVDWLTGAVSVR